MNHEIKLFRYMNRLQGIVNNKLEPPIMVDVDLVSGMCNIDCEWCIQRDSRNLKNPLFMDVETMKAIGPFCKSWGVKSWRMAGDSEPTLNPNLHILLKSGHDNGISMGLITNGTLLHKVKNLKYLTWIGISLDAATADTWSKFKHSPKSNFHKIIKSIKYIRKNYPDIEITLKFVKWSSTKDLGRKDFDGSKTAIGDNYEDAKLLPALAKELGVKYIIKDAFLKKPKYTFDKCLATPLYGVFGADHKFYLCCDRRINYILTDDYTRNNWEELKYIWGSIEHLNMIKSINPKTCPFCPKNLLNTILESVVLDGKKTKEFQVNFI